MAHFCDKWLSAGQGKPRGWVPVKILLALLTLFSFVTLTATACEPTVRLTADNQFDFDVTILHEAVNEQGQVFFRHELGIVSAEQTTRVLGRLLLSSHDSGSVVVLKAIDQSGNVVWQQSWPFDDFLKLKKVGWKIVVSPQTGSPP